MVKFYIATKIERAKDHNVIRDLLTKKGYTLSYDWTTHGNIKRTSLERLIEVSDSMLNAVRTADFVIVLLPGGRGTHTEFGAALALGKKIILHCEDEEVFLPTEKTSAFYHHPLITKIVCPLGEFERHLPKFLPTPKKCGCAGHCH